MRTTATGRRPARWRLLAWTIPALVAGIVLASCGDDSDAVTTTVAASGVSAPAVPVTTAVTSSTAAPATTTTRATSTTRATTTTRPSTTTRATTTTRPSTTTVLVGRSGLPTVAAPDLPPEAQDTLALIDAGGPFPYAKDGTTFGNRERLLPRQPNGYYREYTVDTPGSADRGARRIIAGKGGDRYYTDDHYASFREIVG